MITCGRVLAIVCFAACGLASGVSANDVTAPAAPVLHFRNGDSLTGALVSSHVRNRLAWKSDVFTKPLEFAVEAVQSVTFQLDSNAAALPGPYCFELAGGDVLFGSLRALNDHETVIEAAGLGVLHLDRAMLERISRVNAAEQIYSGPNGLSGWQTTTPIPAVPVDRRMDFLGAGQVLRPQTPPVPEAKAWREEGGQLVTRRAGATLRRDFRSGPQVRYEIELSFTDRPNFELVLAANDDTRAGRSEYRLEVWQQELVAIRETRREVDFAALQTLPTGPGRVHLQLFLDLAAGRLLVVTAAGETLADLCIPNDHSAIGTKSMKGKPQSLPKPKAGQPEWPGVLQLTNRDGDLKLERLTIGRWNGTTPHVVGKGRVRILQTDGAIIQGELQGYDTQARQFVISESGQPRTIDELQVQDVAMPQSANDAALPLLRVLQAGGTRISGDLAEVQAEHIVMECRGIREPLALPLKELRSLIVLRKEGPPRVPLDREGRLELAGVSLHGQLLDAREEESSCLVFQPRHGDTSAPLAWGVSGRLVYREPPPTAKPAAATRRTAVDRVVGGARALAGTRQPASPRPVQPATSSVLHLKSGDALTCKAISINDDGVHMQSDAAEATLIPHKEIKALELDPNAPPVKIDKIKKDRLLMLPRAQRDHPPTHLIRSRDGDYLRGKLLAMDSSQLHVELRLETKILTREQVARIIWLHTDEMDGPRAATRQTDSQFSTRIQAVPRNGNRLTFFAQELSKNTLSGRSWALGACRINLADVDQLLIGQAIEQSAATLAFHQWKLRPAPEPLPAPESGASGSGEGLDSVLVGKPAPAIDLELLDGERFNLVDYKNKIVVLDFWASWCGPCLQVMPQVDQVAREFAARDVRLVTINLEETPERIRSALERLKLDTAVALDRDGRVAERYGATSIPQTVVIDRDGNVARLFVGGGARFDQQLRQALERVLMPRAPEKE